MLKSTVSNCAGQVQSEYLESMACFLDGPQSVPYWYVASHNPRPDFVQLERSGRSTSHESCQSKSQNSPQPFARVMALPWTWQEALPCQPRAGSVLLFTQAHRLKQ